MVLLQKLFKLNIVVFRIFKDHRRRLVHHRFPCHCLDQMSALRGLTKSPLLRREFTSSLHLHCIRRFHLAINDSHIRSLSIAHVFPSLRFTLPPIITSIIPIATGIWDSILRAVPKKKTSHSKKRKRQLVGKALQDKTNLTRCESCGDWRLLHTLCASCVKSIQKDWRRREQLGE